MDIWMKAEIQAREEKEYKKMMQNLSPAHMYNAIICIE
jgi:hypothetical protein